MTRFENERQIGRRMPAVSTLRKAEDDGASFRRVGRRDFQFEEVETGETLDRGPAGDRVVAGALARGRAPRALGNIERHGNGGAVELIGEF